MSETTRRDVLIELLLDELNDVFSLKGAPWFLTNRSGNCYWCKDGDKPHAIDCPYIKAQQYYNELRNME